MDLQTELSAVEAKLDAETDPTEVAVLAGRIIELKNEVAQGATGLPGFLQAQKPVQASDEQKAAPPPVKAPYVPAQASVQAAPAVKAAPATPPAAKAAPATPPAPDPAAKSAPAAQSQTDQLARAAARVGINPSKLPIALRPTRN
jgi:hypothetical protein